LHRCSSPQRQQLARPGSKPFAKTSAWVFLLSNGLGQAGVADGRASRSGGVFGGQLGYRWQVNQFVFGLEGQGD
jgi:hypothetical protein